MKIAIGCDHAGFTLKQVILDAIRESGHEIIDLGTYTEEPVDYPDYAQKVAKEILTGRAERGILMCGSGVGICIAANKISGIYSAICHDTYSAHQGVEHDNMNVLCIGSKVIGPEPAKEIVKSFLNARFVGNDSGQERHQRRVNKVRDLEIRAEQKK